MIGTGRRRGRAVFVTHSAFIGDGQETSNILYCSFSFKFLFNSNNFQFASLLTNASDPVALRLGRCTCWLSPEC